MRWILVGVGLLPMMSPLASCSRQAVVESGPAASTGDVVARGMVRRLGSEGAVRTVIQGDESWVVVGDYEGEIGRAAGAEVWAGGHAATSPYGLAIRVVEYHIVSVDGEVPVVGILNEDEGGFYLTTDDGEVRRLEVSDRLASAVGAKVWVVLGADGVSVSRYGILRD